MVWYNISIVCGDSFHCHVYHFIYCNDVLIFNTFNNEQSGEWVVFLDGHHQLQCRDLQLDGAVRLWLQWKPSLPPSLLLLLLTLHLSDSSSSHPPPSQLYFCQSSHCLISPLSPSIIISTTPLGPLLHRHSLGFASGGQKLHQASWNRPVHPCGPAEEHSGGEQKIWKPYFETLLHDLMSNERWLCVYSRPSEGMSM